MDTKIKIYFPKESLCPDEPWIVFLNPILGKYKEKVWGHDEKQVEERTKNGQQLIESSGMIDCDFVVFPKFFKMDYLNEVKELSDKAKKKQKKVIVFYVSDISDDIKVDNILVFRISITDHNKDNEYCMPVFPGDVLYNNKLSLYSDIDTKKISVGYTGYSDFYNISSRVFYIGLQITRRIMEITWIRKIFYALHKERIYHILSTAGLGKYIRGKVIKEIEKCKSIKFDFIQRKGGYYIDTKGDARKQYLDNLNNNDFPLVIRGNGNASFRLFEVMSLGKIPIFIDTDCRMPFEDQIDYKSIFIRIPFHDIKNTEKYIHKFLTEKKGKLNDIQKEIRQIYLDHLSINGYFTTLIKSILMR